MYYKFLVGPQQSSDLSEAIPAARRPRPHPRQRSTPPVQARATQPPTGVNGDEPAQPRRKWWLPVLVAGLALAAQAAILPPVAARPVTLVLHATAVAAAALVIARRARQGRLEGGWILILAGAACWTAAAAY